MELHGARALVTGGASGIGAASVAQLRVAGARVVSLDLADAPDADASVQVDVGDPESYGQIDASVHTGDLNAQAFGVVKDGLFRSFNQKRKGQYRLHAHVGAGDLRLYSTAQ